MNNHTHLFIGGPLDGERIEIPHHLEIYRHLGGDYFIWTITLHSKKNPYIFFYLHESLSYDEGIEKLISNYQKINDI